MNTAIIVAAGSGTRFGSDIPKQFVEIGGRQLLSHTLEKFEACDEIEEIVLVLSEDQIPNFRSEISKLRTVVAGGASRAVSVQNGLAAVSENTKIVAVHDGARPLVTVEEIAQTVMKAAETGAACLVAEVSDTIKHVEGGEIVRTVDRTKLRRALTPQAFRVDI
ncbi:MAG: 2-C-methyl-D-erythritol 4-phosphate cytidylyltransferase, partial [Blastocatellia bacterium]|nr:2-C-methyl-D-erythritol 4-phosphate cytidylyltransferase [Blastocatellia bacterium]